MYKKDEVKKEIVFLYPIDGIFDSAARVSAYNSKNLKDNQGNSMLGEFAISDDDKDMFIQGLNTVLPEIYEKIIKITDGTSADAFGVDMMKTGEKQAVDKEGKPSVDNEGNPVMEDIIENCVYFKIKNNDAYNKNVLLLVDTSFLECIIEGSLHSWYKNAAQSDFMAMYARSFAYNLEKLFSRMFQLKIKKTVNMLGMQS